ncbi:hypothetical protein BKA61DRAFT_678587 [Leptodontidium sp. MPI-SDFR-AT-0119]|nr:hypothetical protein BKA61DRAFT_678587 [Leptodontidium sp. MPI-SDFR-AT-0119]
MAMEKSASELAEIRDIDPSPDALEPPSAPLQSNKNSSSWRIDWLVPTQMVGLLVIGTLLAVGHHLFYSSLAGHPIGKISQQWATRYGTAFTFLVKASLISAISTAYIQHIWVMFRKKPMSIGTLDATFSATTDPFSFLNLEMLNRVKIGTVLALLIWTIPLAMVVPPSTLFVIPVVMPEVLNLPVKTPNFTVAETFVELSVVEFLTPDDRGGVNKRGVNERGVSYDGPRPQLSNLATVTTIGGDVVSIESPAPNASYTLQFFGPWMQCYTANSTTINILNSTMRSTLDYTAVLNKQEQLLVGWLNFDNGIQIQGVLCELFNTSYTVHFNFTNTVQTVNLLNRTIVNSTAISTSSVLYTNNIVDPVNTTELDSSTSPALQTFSYLGMLDAFTNVIGGNLSHIAGYVVTSSVLQTKLAFGPDLYPIFSAGRSILYPNLTVQAGLEEMWFNFTISLFGVNANVTTFNETTTITSNLVHNVFQYNARDLLLAYFISVFFASFAVLVGIRAVFINHVSYAANFSSILRTTRNPSLDNIVRNTTSTGLDKECNCMGVKPLAKSLRGTQLKFGIVDGLGHAAFDVVEEGRDGVQEIRGRTECPGNMHE